jgi:hypothetical protein
MSHQSLAEHGELDAQWFALNQRLHDLDRELNGNRSKQQVGEKTKVTVGSRLSAVSLGTSLSTYGPTPTHQQNLRIAREELSAISAQVKQIVDQDLPAFEQKLADIGAPYVH